ncbi:MAG: DUF2993 domain-containing protein [Bacillota bacterium]|nr:DUF2993 domain-containing protein [Bacillota bacterium]
MRWAVVAGVIALALLLVAGELFLPMIVAKGLEAGLGRTLGQGAALEASLQVRPALRLLIGRVDKLTIESRQVKTATLTIDSIAVTVEDIAVNLRSLLTRSGLSVTRNARVGAVIRISEASLRRYVLDNVEGFSDPAVKISADKVAVVGYIRFANRPLLVSVEGRFVAGSGQRVDFVVDRMSMDTEPVPPRLTAAVISALGGPELFIDLERFPVPLELREVKLQEGWLVIEASTK